MGSIDKSLRIQGTIGSLAKVDGTGLVRVPVESLNTESALRVMEVQIFELADAVAELAEAVKELSRRPR